MTCHPNSVYLFSRLSGHLVLDNKNYITNTFAILVIIAAGQNQATMALLTTVQFPVLSAVELIVIARIQERPDLVHLSVGVHPGTHSWPPPTGKPGSRCFSTMQERHIFSVQTKRNKIAPVVVDVGVIWIIIDVQTKNHSLAPKQLDTLHDVRLILCKLKGRNHTTPEIRTRR